VGDVISGVDFLATGYLALGPTVRWKYVTQEFIGNYAKIQVFWTFDWLSSVSGSKVMANNYKIGNFTL